MTQYSQAIGVTAGQNRADKHKSSCSCFIPSSIRGLTYPASFNLSYSVSFSLSHPVSFSLSYCASFSLSYSASFSFTYSVSLSFRFNKGSRCTDEHWSALLGSGDGHDRRRVLGWLAGDRAKPG